MNPAGQPQPAPQNLPLPPQAQQQPYILNLDINPNDTPEIKALKEMAAKQQREKIREEQLRQQKENDLKKLDQSLQQARNEKQTLEQQKQQMEHERIKEQQIRIQLEQEIQKLEHEKLVRRMADVDINAKYRQPPPQAARQILAPPKLILKNPQEMQVTETEKSNTKFDTLADSQQIMIELWKKTAGNDRDLLKLIDDLERNVQTQKDNTFLVSQQINQATTVAKQYKPTLPYPNNIIDRRRQAEKPRIMDPRTISQTIKSFNPDSKPKPDFADTWRFILNYTEGEEMLEEEYKTILNYCLEGDAHRLFNDLKEMNKPLKEILEAFTQLYTRRRTLDDDISDFNSFKRHPKEPIYSSMQRAKILAERLEKLYSSAAWPEIKNNMLKCVLTQIISKNCKKFLSTEERKHKRVGADIDYDTLIDLVEDYEATHDDMPNSEIETVFNACSFTAKNDADVIMARMKAKPAFRDKSQNRSKSLDTKIDTLSEQISQITAVMHKERNKYRSPSPYTRTATSTSDQNRSRRSIYEANKDVEMTDTTKPVVSSYHRSPTPGTPLNQPAWHTRPKQTPMYDKHKTDYNTSNQKSKQIHFGDSTFPKYNRPETPKYDQKTSYDYKKPYFKDNQTSNYNRSSSYDQNKYGSNQRSYSNDRYKYGSNQRSQSYDRSQYGSNQRSNSYNRDRDKYNSYRNRSQSRDRYSQGSRYRDRSSSRNTDYRKQDYRDKYRDSKTKYPSRPHSENRYRNHSQDRYHSESENGTNRNRNRASSREKDGHAVKVLINSNDNICDLCKQQIQVNSMCAITGKTHNQLN